MIVRYSVQWFDLLNRLKEITIKSNREVLCLECWTIFNYEKKLRHLYTNPSHRAQIRTSKDFASEHKILALAESNGRLIRYLAFEAISDPFIS